MNPIHHQKHAAVQHWFEQPAKQAHITTTPAPPISEKKLQNPTKPLAADLLLIDVSLKEPGRDGQTVAIDFIVVSPAAESYCKQSAKEPLHAAALREATKISKYARAYKEMDTFTLNPLFLRVEVFMGKEPVMFLTESAILLPDHREKAGLPLHTSGNLDS